MVKGTADGGRENGWRVDAVRHYSGGRASAHRDAAQHACRSTRSRPAVPTEARRRFASPTAAAARGGQAARALRTALLGRAVGTVPRQRTLRHGASHSAGP